MHHTLRALTGVLVLAACLTAGCQVGGNRYSLFGGTHLLSDQARGMAAANGEPLPLARELAKKPIPAYIVEPGDVLLVHPLNLDSPARLSGDQPVLPDGRIQLGIYGMPMVAGKSIDEVEAEINALVRLKTRDAGPIAVRLMTRDSKVYYVLGEVNSPGTYPLRGRETALDGIVAAGGLTASASRFDIVLSRPTRPDSCRIVLPVCYTEIVQLGDTSTNYQLRPGDRIFVPTRTFHEWLCPTRRACPGACGRPQTPCPPPHEPEVLPGPPAGPAQLLAPLPAPELAPAPADNALPKPRPAEEAEPAPAPRPNPRPEADRQSLGQLPWQRFVTGALTSSRHAE